MMKHKVFFLSLMAVLVSSIILAACGSKPALDGKIIQKGGSNLDFKTADIDDNSVQAYNQFAMKLYHQIVKTEERENIFISPFSIAAALSMTLNGADTDTLEAMISTLELSGMSVEDINKSNQILMNLLQHGDASVELSIANSLWIREDSEIFEVFTQTIEEYYNAFVQELDFSSSSSANTINAWVKEQTKEKINQIVEHPIDEDTLLFLINAIYFKGDWTHPFDEGNTQDASFYSVDGSASSVPMMYLNDRFEYLKTNTFEAIRLPYGEEDWNMVVVLPDEALSIQELHTELMNNPSSWTSGYNTTNGAIHLPRFQMEYELGLNDTLKALGMEIAFDPYGADFTAMGSTPPNIYIKNVKHKSFIDVNEEGTEAAAVTSVEAGGITSMPVLGFEMIVDRPFFFAIEDRSTGVIVFMGSIFEL